MRNIKSQIIKNLFLGLVSLIFVCLTSGQSLGQTTKELLERAKATFENQKFDEAISDLNTVISREPSHEEALTYRARAFILQKKIAEAGADADKALAINPRNLFALNVRGMVKGEKKDYKGAIDDFTQALTLDPTFFRSYYQRGRAKAFSGKYLSTVLADYDLYLKYNEDVGVINEAGNYCLAKEGAFNVCAAYFSRIKSKNPNLAAGYLGYALAYFNVYETVADKSIFKGEILNNFRKAIELDPKDEIAPLNLGRLLFKLEDYDGSVAALSQAIANNPKRAWSYALRGDNYRVKKDYDRAIDDYSKAIELDASFGDAYKFRAKMRDEKGEKASIGYKTEADKSYWQQTLNDYKKTAELSDQDYEAYNNLDNFVFSLARFAASQQNNSALEKQLDVQKDEFYKSLISANPKNVCARYYLLQNSTYYEARDGWDALINNYDSKHGAKCASAAALWIGRIYAEGDKYRAIAANYEKAREYYDLAIKFDSTQQENIKNWIAQLPYKAPVISTGTISDTNSVDYESRLSGKRESFNFNLDWVENNYAGAETYLKQLLEIYKEKSALLEAAIKDQRLSPEARRKYAQELEDDDKTIKRILRGKN